MRNLLILAMVLILASCARQTGIKLIDPANFNTGHDGKKVTLYTIKNANGVTVQITNYGGRVVNLWVPDANGNFKDVVTGYPTIGEYFKSNDLFFGAIVGRYANRISKGTFSIKNKSYHLAINNAPNALHGGPKGFFNVVWDGKQLSDSVLEIYYLAKDGEEGYPGNLQVKIDYTITANNSLKIEYFAETDDSTVVNLTHHSYFNLSGNFTQSINDHLLQINADKFTPVDSTLIPTGELASVDQTPMDFRTPVAIGTRLESNFQQLKYGSGYDHNWVINTAASGLNFAASITSPVSKINMKIYTNEPGIQFYGGNFLAGKDTGKYGITYQHRTAFCLETQHYPDSPNKPDFPSTLLAPGQKYYSICIYQFGIE